MNIFSLLQQDDAKLIESTFYGFGSEKFDVSMYEYAMNGMQYVEIRTKNTCIPVSGHNKGKNGFNDWGFSGLQEGIKDASVFDIPRECRHTSPVSVLLIVYTFKSLFYQAGVKVNV